MVEAVESGVFYWPTLPPSLLFITAVVVLCAQASDALLLRQALFQTVVARRLVHCREDE